MWSVKAIAERDGVSKQAVSTRAKRFAAESGLVVERDERNRILRLDVDQYDRLRSRFSDPAKAQGPAKGPERTGGQLTAQAPASKDAPELDLLAADSSYNEARRIQAWTKAERDKLALEVDKQIYVRRDEVTEAVSAAGAAIATIIDRLPNAADDLAATVGRDGSRGLRIGLAKEAARIRSEIAAALRGGQALSDDQGETDEPVML